jgi:hypothetical protein
MALEHRLHPASFLPTRALASALLAVAAILSGCARRPASEPPAPSRPPAAPVADTAGVTPESINRRGDFAYAPGEYRYEVASETSVEMLADSTGGETARSEASGIPLVDTVTTLVHLTYRIEQPSPALPDGGEQQAVTGTVDSFTVRSAGLVPTGERPLPAPLSFRATLAGGRTPTQFEATPDTACAAPDAALLALARDFLLPLPISLAPGSEWRDTVTTTTCRAGIPVTTESIHSYRVVGSVARDSIQALRVTRESAITVQGQGFPREQTVTVAGTGQGSGELFLDAAAGRYLGGAVESRVELTVTNGVQTKRFLQRATQQISPRQ